MWNTKQIIVQQSNYEVTPIKGASAFGEYYTEIDLSKQSDYPQNIFAVVPVGAYQISNANNLGILSVTGYWSARLNATEAVPYMIRVAYFYTMYIDTYK